MATVDAGDLFQFMQRTGENPGDYHFGAFLLSHGLRCTLSYNPAPLGRQLLPARKNGGPPSSMVPIQGLPKRGETIAIDHAAVTLSLLAMPPLTIQDAFKLAMQHHQTERLKEAEQLYRQILAQQPGHVGALHLLGVIAAQVEQYDVAVNLIGQAIALKPDWPEAQNNLGNALKSLGRLDEAIVAYRQALALKPGYAQAHYNLGSTLQSQGHLDQAIAAYRQAITVKPRYPEAYYNCGNALRDNGQLDEAIAAYQQAIALKPDFADAYNNLGYALQAQGRLDQAVKAYRQAIALRPGYAEALNNLSGALKNLGQLDEAIAAQRQALALKPGFFEAHSNLILSLHYHPNFDAAAIATEHRRWNLLYAEPLKKFIQPHANDRNLDRRLRIGYVSADFRTHASAYFLVPLLEHHDTRQVELFCYAQVARPDEMTHRFQQHAQWRSTVGVSDEQIAQQIRQDRIDILVDLKLHTAGNRLLVFAHKPAPVQVTWLGYPGSTGLTAIDYRLSDPYLDPPGMDESVYSEQTIRLPDTFWCYDPLNGRDVPLSPLPAMHNGVVTFGCLNNFCKVNDGVLAAWARVLQQVKNSRLLLLAPEGEHRQQTVDRLGKEGIDPNRVEFAPRQSRREYLELYHRIDIGLDSFPYNGHTTSLDSFWMGVPVVTLVGQKAVSRAGLCQLSNLGLADLAGQTPEQFVQIAVALANDLPRLQQLRSTLRQRMGQSQLMDAPRFAANVEAAYRWMWRKYSTCG